MVHKVFKKVFEILEKTLHHTVKSSGCLFEGLSVGYWKDFKGLKKCFWDAGNDFWIINFYGIGFGNCSI